MQETLVRFLGWEDPLEKGTATHSGILAWRIPWAEEPGKLPTIHGVAKSRTQLSDFHFTSFHRIKLLPSNLTTFQNKGQENKCIENKNTQHPTR